MGGLTDLTGQRFGRWTVLADIGRRNGARLWRCQCDCGAIRDVGATSLRNGTSQSCGCLHKGLLPPLPYQDLTGKKFHHLTVVQAVSRKGGKLPHWKCRCDCGKIVFATSSCLVNGTLKSCGCWKNERVPNTRYMDLRGQTFGRLVVLEDAGRHRGCVLWKCQCICGNLTYVPSCSLRGGGTQSCGCLHKERVSETRFINLTGQKFERLTVIEYAGQDKWGKQTWKCQCECGNITTVVGANLRSRATQSCGCYNKELNSGTNHHKWKGGITPAIETIRKCVQYKTWRRAVFQRDYFTCRDCNQLRGKLNAHHIVPFSKIMEEHDITTLEEAQACKTLWDVSNGITLCLACHRKVHTQLALDKTRQEGIF